MTNAAIADFQHPLIASTSPVMPVSVANIAPFSAITNFSLAVFEDIGISLFLQPLALAQAAGAGVVDDERQPEQEQ